MKEFDLYEPMREWLEGHLIDKHPNCEIITTFYSCAQSLYLILEKYGIKNEVANGIDIQIDVLGIVKKKDGTYLLYFIEAKNTPLTLKDLGQLWAYCKLIVPEEAFLLSSKGIGTLKKVLYSLKREDLLIYGNDKRPKYMIVGEWDVSRRAIDYSSIIPK